MGHDHHHHHQKEGANLLWAFFLNAGFAVVEFIGGYLTNSIAITSDALHDLGDSVALLFAYFSEKLSHKQADQKFTYGYRRFSVLSAVINGVILLVGSCFIIYEAVIRLQDPQPVLPEGMLALGILGILVNGFAAYKLSQGSGMNQRMVTLHLLEDLLGWGAVILVSVVLMFRPWFILDSILSILISLIILKGVYKNLMKAGSIFLQKFPDDLEMEEMIEQVLELDGIQDVHALRGWALDEINFSVSFHVVVSSNMRMREVDELKGRIKKILEERKVKFSSVEFEGERDKC